MIHSVPVTFHSPFSAEFWSYCVLSGGAQRSALPHHQNEEMNEQFISSNEDRTHDQSRLRSHTCATAPRLASNNILSFKIFKLGITYCEVLTYFICYILKLITISLIIIPLIFHTSLISIHSNENESLIIAH